MKTNELENREIGELISEITEKGWGRMGIEFLEERTGFIGLHSRPLVCVSVTNHDLPDDENEISIEAGSLVECLGLIVDSIRWKRGEPSLAEEVAALMLQQETHESLPPVICGPDARCRCGSRAPLILTRKVDLAIDWADGEFLQSPRENSACFLIPKPGEIATCPDCGLSYQINP